MTRRRRNSVLDTAVAWTRRLAGLAAIGGIALLFAPAERVPIPVEYGGSADGATVSASVDGPALYAEYCSACHGFGGEGGRGPALAGRIETIGRSAVRVKVAKGGLTMPAFTKTLTGKEIEAIIDHLATMPPH